MPITLRGINDPTNETVVLPAFKTVLPGSPTPNTYLAQQDPAQTGLGLIYLNGAFQIATSAFPCVLLRAAGQHSKRNSRSTYSGTKSVIVSYFDEFEENATQSIDDIYNTIITPDLLRMQSNLETNDSLTQNFVAFCQDIPDISLSPYVAGQELESRLVPGKLLVVRHLTIQYVTLPYDCLV